MKLPQFTPEEIRTGFTDARLEYLCSTETYWNDRRNYRGRGGPYWTQEVYSIGRCLREISGWPSWLPIPVSTDHGVYFGPTETLEPHEISFPGQVHLTWSTWRLASRPSARKKKIKLITHPWVLYRRKVGYTKSPEASGTLIFVPHSTPGFELPHYSLQPVIEAIRPQAHCEAPIVLMISMHDVNLGLHRKLRSVGVKSL